MAIYLLVGPSGIGKSTVLDFLRDNYRINGEKLDCLMKEYLGIPSISKHLSEVGAEKFFEESKQIIEKTNVSIKENFIIDVGAGSLEYKEGVMQWLLSQNLISLKGNAEIIWKSSNRQEYYPGEKGYEKYKEREFIEKEYIYNAAKHIIDVTPRDRNRLTVEEVATEIYKNIR